MIKKYPHHGLQAWLQIHIFYNGVDDNIRSNLDIVVGGSIMFHTYERAYKIIDDTAINSYMWLNVKFTYKSNPPMVKAINEDDRYHHVIEKLNSLESTVRPAKS